MNIRHGKLLGFFALLLTMATQGLAQEGGWPRSLSVKDGSVTVYPLQVESMSDDLVRFRAALAYRETGESEPVFGVGWFVSKVEIDRSKNIVHPTNLVVSDTRFPSGTDDVKQELTAVFARNSQAWDLDFPLEDLVSSLDTAEQEAKSIQDLNTDPPTIIYKDRPALLVNFDGEPVLRKIENSEYQAVINTAYPLIYDGNAYYLGAADNVWYRADSAKGPYRFVKAAPEEIVSMVDEAREPESDSEPAEKVTAANAPEIVVATKPTELIVTEGPAAFVPLIDDLLVLSNTSDDVFMHISTQKYYVVLAGRWYHSSSLNGPWAYSASDELPEAFASIPEQSDQAGSRVYVAGTDEAREAVLDAQIPQTAAVERGTVDLDVSYDGDPQFEAVEGTQDLAYANNTGSTVLQADRQYYLVEDGVWYVSSMPNGPWQVSAYRPVQVAAISPQSPVYNVKYVYIYDSTPDVVYVGYTPGYTGSYVYHNTIVYGTGWYYRPWVTPHYYYPRYSTWGFNVSYNSWYGWSFGLSWGWGPFYAGWHSGGYWHHGRPWYGRRYGCWGPRGYRPRPRHHGRYAHGRGGYDRGGYDRGNRGRDGYDGNRNGERGGGPGNSKRGGKNAYVRNDNLYRDGAQKAKLAGKSGYGRGGEKLNRVAGKGASGVKNGRSNKGVVTNSELRVKAQARDARYGALNGKILAKNTVSRKSKLKNSPVRNNGSWETVSATNEVRRTKKETARSVEKPTSRYAGGKSTRSNNGATAKARQGKTSQRSISSNKTMAKNSTRAAGTSGKTQQVRTSQRSVSSSKPTANNSRQTARTSGKTQQVKTSQRSVSPGKSSVKSGRQKPAAQTKTMVNKRSTPTTRTNRSSAPQRQKAKASTPQRTSRSQSAPKSNGNQKNAPVAKAGRASSSSRGSSKSSRTNSRKSG